MIGDTASVVQDLALNAADVEILSGQLRNPNASSAIPWESLYVWPSVKASGNKTEGGNPEHLITITAWRVGENVAPLVNGQWTIGDTTYNIQEVGPTYAEDEADDYAVYECVCTRIP